MKIIENGIFETARHQNDFSQANMNDELLCDVRIKEPLEKYLLLTMFPNRFENENLLNIYYNRFYWFNKFRNDYIYYYGDDNLNLEQQRFKILEEGDRFSDIDWNIIESIQNQNT
ncbi:hypothetical protein [Pedobacter endophyticus]|uniref:Uncharacterized protein n=1 Tax=Pedobacter endophyticus TaxID=2789740 RepID=A0A7S9KYY9_9SPHI|nr:hypothetical protein [Pedobacter endophyticus]QPH39435.1 hypothetical protein IZT61_20725 [Pedobacter endophyticus]